MEIKIQFLKFFLNFFFNFRSRGACGGEITSEDMARLMKQVSIESPSHKVKDCIFNFETPMPDVPEGGARIKVRLRKL